MALEDLSFFRRVRQIELVASKLVDQLLGGRYRSIFRGQGIEFDEVREYVAGDDVRAIDWNVTSRMGLPHTKIFREEREIILFNVVDLSASLYAGSGEIAKNEYAAHVFAILSLAAVKNNDRVGAAFFSDRIEKWIPPAKGRKHILSLIHELLKITPQGKGSDLDLALKGVYRNLKRRGICFIISDFRTEGYWDSLSLLAGKHDCVAVRIVDPADTVFPGSGLIELEDPESGDVLLADGSSAAFRSAYQRYWQDQQTAWQAGCALRGVQTLTLSTSDDPGAEILRFFRRRRKAGRLAV
jgi:uncharacterized protein (DUF58 family)